MKSCYPIFLLFCLSAACVTRSSVIKQVSFDKNCSEDKVNITKELIGSGTGSYKVEACGKEYDYRHAGTVIFEKGKGPAGTEGM